MFVIRFMVFIAILIVGDLVVLAGIGLLLEVVK